MENFMKKTVIFIAAMVLLSDMPVKALDLSAECAYLMTADSGICIYEKNEPAVILSAKSKKATFLCLSGVCCLCNTC